ncbi:hypothetical protein N481_14285 [Pseudoalteromonas luteoviolacea S4047-1]|uniref:Uncharacterized protein n=1 Tax=Pseudoalteromonas luteoviolacea S4054 TaxID=1129367 RepID=A0A0F6ACQ4_9GAMM|nr:hypothetical protein N479_13150 [Pseudoalteromonas luteoviolacea S4054]KZN72790.1 hypothetical protein N481_14285 [Pseudoalteromonas luteoviolacea S4047-1]
MGLFECIKVDDLVKLQMLQIIANLHEYGLSISLAQNFAHGTIARRIFW